ncbi:MAG: UDP-N-acetylmuramoyl-L-alanine--D-glutamate ligase [Myxococcales bacterium]|nr:UDP-N-acetylmuramoyl-L-alanine--D-glutamate ligase [Myxococcales bacterium]
MLDVRGKRVVVVGLGKSGVAAARLLCARGAEVVANDGKSREALGAVVAELEGAGIRVVAGGHAAAEMDRADLVVVSPGVPPLPEIAAAERAGVRVIGEVEAAVRCLTHPAPIVAVGGTNGKSTVTTLLGDVLGRFAPRVFVGGNLGEPLAAHADERFDFVVLEVSSFQMERVETFHPRASILLNVTPDHLDRYPDMAAYAHAKGNAFARQTAEDLAVVPAGDDVCVGQARRGGGRLVTFGADGDARVSADAITFRGEVYPRKDILLQGGHNAQNVAAVIAVARDLGVPEGTVRAALAEFRGLGHRMAFVVDVGGVRFYDDSKGTNVGAAVTALLGLPEPKVVLVAGGRDKGGSYEPLADALAQKGRAAVLIGEAAEAIASAVGSSVPVVRAASMDEAVRRAHALAAPGDAVLLSPACSSFDMFRDYAHRGDEFARAARSLATEATPR